LNIPYEFMKIELNGCLMVNFIVLMDLLLNGRMVIKNGGLKVNFIVLMVLLLKGQMVIKNGMLTANVIV